jgi:hypothetical protein
MAKVLLEGDKREVSMLFMQMKHNGFEITNVDYISQDPIMVYFHIKPHELVSCGECGSTNLSYPDESTYECGCGYSGSC